MFYVLILNDIFFYLWIFLIVCVLFILIYLFVMMLNILFVYFWFLSVVDLIILVY